ncbi:twin-arginine translocase TatA/TatE family subunit [Candidatus Bathyarchaeota archaeon]|nr:twin-arginine translocase TatA/TatE family subunit [Candidatus Bathyarchaeota archaeon]
MAFIGPWEIALILAIVLILFGPKKLPELARSLGDAIRQYRLATEGAIPPAASGTPTQAWPQTPAYPSQTKPGEILIETAKKLGIQTEGKTLDEVSEEIAEQASKKKSE